VAFNLNLLRAIGILLVTNSHFDALYPDPRMGTGGAFGNAIFFALSGYGLAFSYRNRGGDFSLGTGVASCEFFRPCGLWRS
jgi:peptidoglycan/LPS O-acetylase OafA/YrhL